MAKKTTFRRPRPKFIRPRACLFCEGNIQVDWKDPGVLRKYISERGKILARAKTGNCATHQRHLTKAIKRARHIALLPFRSTL